MKRIPTALRPLATGTLLATLALGAQAQSSVNVYGLMDLSVGSTKAPGGTATTAVDSGKLTTSYYGFGGREDLGGGLAATFRIEGFLRAASGDAGRFTGDPQTASLKVSFFGPFFGGYHVIALDPGYRWAMVIGPTTGYLWILAREPVLDPAVRERLVAQARSVGVATDELIWVEHGRAPR